MQKIGRFKTRLANNRLQKNGKTERILHAPEDAAPEYDLYRKSDGTLIYNPVKS